MFSWRDFDLNQPINWAHPLNRGRLAWWLAVPQLWGGTWYDLVGGYAGTLTGLSAGDGWNTASNPGGAGSIKLSGGSGEYVSGPTLPSLAMPSGTLALWLNFTSHSATSGLLSKWNSSTAANTAVFGLTYGSGNLNLYLGNGSAHTNTAVAWSPTNGIWYFVAVAWNGTNTWYYVNGKQQGSTATQSSYSSYSNGNPVRLGGGNNASNAAINGFINDASVWNRSLSASEIFALYALSQQWYPDVLTWESSDVLRLLAAAPLGALSPSPLVYRPRFHPAYFE
jgi:hypothetical protein